MLVEIEAGIKLSLFCKEVFEADFVFEGVIELPESFADAGT